MIALTAHRHVEGDLLALVGPGRARPDAHLDRSWPRAPPDEQQDQRRCGNGDQFGAPRHHGQDQAGQGQVEQTPGVAGDGPVQLEPERDGRAQRSGPRLGLRASQHRRPAGRPAVSAGQKAPAAGSVRGVGTDAMRAAMTSSALTWRTHSSGRSTTR